MSSVRRPVLADAPVSRLTRVWAGHRRWLLCDRYPKTSPIALSLYPFVICSAGCRPQPLPAGMHHDRQDLFAHPTMTTVPACLSFHELAGALYSRAPYSHPRTAFSSGAFLPISTPPPSASLRRLLSRCPLDEGQRLIMGHSALAQTLAGTPRHGNDYARPARPAAFSLPRLRHDPLLSVPILPLLASTAADPSYTVSCCGQFRALGWTRRPDVRYGAHSA
ncbi:hypothetical protein FB45DRAFT_1018753 [Roridomyces roridus]|uniref:Uncharacterized protein n=1 Tax=Roridomyces roridus TaxID=1738132 RepID=A0AAD7CL86_9AGAR|nr:hypothetical protein FB45DRAFT_1018753 [Roridomyces roridus]